MPDVPRTERSGAGELTVAEWFEELDRGLEYRRLYGVEDAWNRLEATMYQVTDSQLNAGPNVIMSTGDALMSSLNVPFPYISVQARQSAFVVGARMQEAVDNMLLDDLDMVSEVERAIINCYLTGRGFLKIGYDSLHGYSPDWQIKDEKGQNSGMTLTQYDKQGRLIEFGKARPGMPWVECAHSQDIVVPWGCFDIDYCPWIAHRVVRHIDEIKGDPKYKTRGLVAGMSMSDFVKSYETTMKPYRIGQEVFDSKATRDVEYVELWEIHDRRTRKIFVIATGHDKFLRNETDELQLEGGLPFVGLCFVPRSRNFWTTPDAYYLEQVQAELSDIAIQGTKERRSSIQKWLVDDSVFDDNPDMEDNLLSAEVGAIVKVKTNGRPMSEIIVQSTQNPNFQIPAQVEQVRRNAREMIGLSANQVGEFDTSGRRSATEAQIVNNASTLRMDRRQAALGKLYRDIFRKINPIIWNFWTVPRVVDIMGPDAQQMYLPVTGQFIRGDYRYKVGFSTDSPETLAQRKQNALQLYMALRQDPMIDPVKLAQQLTLAFNNPEFNIFKEGALNGQIDPAAVQVGSSPTGPQSAGSGGQGPQGGGQVQQ